MIKINTTKQNMKRKALFKFKDIEIHYNLPNTADVYYLTNNTEYNKKANQLLLDRWYKRLRLAPSEWLIELQLGFEYTWHWHYVRDDELYLADKERRANIRQVPFII